MNHVSRRALPSATARRLVGEKTTQLGSKTETPLFGVGRLAATAAAAAMLVGLCAAGDARAAQPVDDGGPQIWMEDSPGAGSANASGASNNATSKAQAKKSAPKASTASARTDIDQEAVEQRSRQAQQPKVFGAQTASGIQKGGWGGASMATFGSSKAQDPQRGVDAGERVLNPNAKNGAESAPADDALTINARAKAQATLDAAQGTGGPSDITYPSGRGATIPPQGSAGAFQAQQAQQAAAQAQGWPALPPLPGAAGGAVVGAVLPSYAVAQPLQAQMAAAQQQPALAMDQAPVPAGQEFERLDENARAARLAPAGVPNGEKKKVEARVYQVGANGALSLAFREELSLLPNDPAKIERMKKTPYAKLTLTGAKESDFSHRVTGGSTSDVAQTGVRAGFLWRPALAGGSWVETAFSASLLAGFDEMESFNGRERTPRLAQRSALVDFDVSNSAKPQMAWLPAEGADTLSGQDAGRSVYWLLAVGSPESFKAFDPKKAAADAKSGAF